MNDRELLEMAAKAAGYTIKDYYDVNGGWWSWCHELKNYWHPLTDDGDALLLAITLPTINISAIIMAAWQAHNDDISRRAYVRREVTKAAAEIGRGMK